MARRLIDLSVCLDDIPQKPERHRPRIEYSDHESVWGAVEVIAPGLPREAFRGGKAWATEQVSLSTHSGTHMDAPWHYHPTMNEALPTGIEKAATIDQVPIEWCMQPGVKLDFREFPAGHVVTASDVERELGRIRHALAPLEIVLVNTRAGSLYGTDDYWNSHCGLGREATMYLLERGVRVVGTDAWGWDIPFSFAADEYRQRGSATPVWDGHKAGADIGYYQMEKLTNLEKLPGKGFMVICFPVKIRGASAGWTRAIAVLDGGEQH